MALEGFQFGNTTPAPVSAPAAPSTGSALKGFSIGATAAPAPVKTPAVPISGTTALKGFTATTTPAVSTSTPAVNIDKLVADTKAPDTSSLFAGFAKANNLNIQPIPSTSIGGQSTPKTTTTDVVANLGKIPGAVSDVVSTAINTPLKKASDLLSNTQFITQAAAGLNADAGHTANRVLTRLSALTQGLSGLTGGIYKPLTTGGSTEDDTTTKVIKGISYGLGVAASIGVTGGIVGGTTAAGSAVEGLTNLANKFPLIAKYVTPFIQPLVENTTGIAAYGQLDPKLGGDIKARVEKLGIDIGTAPLYTALGAIKNAGISIPASFTLGFGMAKLSGASNQDALVSGASFAFLDGVGRAGGERGFTTDEIHAKLNDEALKILNNYSETKLTKDSTPEELKAAFRAAAHQTHPDVGGSAEEFSKVKNAYDLLSKGATGKTEVVQTEPEKSIAQLKGDIKTGIEKYGEDATHQALMTNLGLDTATADRLVTAAKVPQTTAEIKALNEKVLAQVKPQQEDLLAGEFDINNEDKGKFDIKNDTGGRSFGTIKGNTANIVNIDSGGQKGTHFFEKIVNDLSDKGIKTINVKLQNEDSSAVLSRMVEKGILSNPRNKSGSSNNEHFTTFDIVKGEMSPEERTSYEKEVKSLTPKSNIEQTIDDISSGKLKIRTGDDLKTEKMDTLGRGNYAYIFRNNESHDTLDAVAHNAGVSSDELLRRIVDRKNAQGGFINPGQIAEDISKFTDDKIKGFITKSLEPIKVAENFSEGIVKLEGEAQADLETINKIIMESKITAIDDEAVYHHAEDPNFKLTPKQEKLAAEDKVIADLNRGLFENIKGTGTPLPDSDTYISRIAKEKPSTLQRVFNPVKGRSGTAGQGSILSKTTGSLKHRTFHLATNDKTGEQIVVHIPTDKTKHVTGFKDKTTNDLGPIQSKKGGMRKPDGEQLKKRLGETFIDKDGNSYTIGQATTRQIEQHTNQQYYHSALASRLLQYAKLRQIDRAIQFVESWKESKDFQKVALPSDKMAPEGWRPTSNVYFRNYNFEPRTAEILDDMQDKLKSGNFNDAFTGINRVLADSIFFNGLAHPINVTVTWLYNRGVSGIAPQNLIRGYKAGARALEAMSTKNDDYMELLRKGAHLMSSDVTNKKVAENIVKKLNTELEKNPDIHQRVINALGLVGENANPVNFKKNIIYKMSHDLAWLSNDFLTMQSIFEVMDKYNMSMEDAIKETARFIPDYRQQSRLLDKPLTAIMGQERGGATSRFIAKKLIYNRNVSMFGAYHVGLLQSFTNAIKDTINAGEGFNKESNSKRASGADKLAMLALLMLVVYPFLDKVFQKITGKTNTYITRAGITKYPYLAYKALTGQTSITNVLTGLIPPAVGLQAGAELFFNRDFFNGSNIYGIGGEGLGGFASSKVAPVAEINKIATDKSDLKEFGLSLFGVHSPSSTQINHDLTAMLYTEKPQVMKEMKTRIVANDQVGADVIGHEFNVRLKELIKENDIAAGNSGSDARVTYFLNQYGVKQPGQLALSNFKTKQGVSVIDKILPNGKPVVKTQTVLPATGVIGAITTYAKAIGTDPITAFKYIFSNQSIRQVTNGTIIVNRMSLSESQSKKSDLAGGNIPKGMILDHIVPLEGGGSNDESNLQLITTAQDGNADNQPVEDFVGNEIKNGNMTSAQAREISIRFKAGQGQQLSPELMKEYKDKYDSKPLTKAQVLDYRNGL